MSEASSPVVPPPATPPPRAPARAMRRRQALWNEYKRTWYFFRRNTLALIGLGIILLFVGIAIYAYTLPIPWNGLVQYCATSDNTVTCAHEVCTYTPPQTPPGPNCYATPTGYAAFIAPTVSVHGLGPLPFGSLTVSGGSIPYFYNIYNGLLRGTDWSLFISVSIVLGGALIGLLLGAVAGYLGGWGDEVIMRITDIFLSIPFILWVIIVVSVVSTVIGSSVSVSYLGIYLLIIALMAIWWPTYTRIIRAQVLIVREQKFVEAARASGAKNGRIILHHIIPNSMYPMLVQMSLDVGTIPLLIGALIFLGFKLFPSQYFPEWGDMSANAVNTTLVQTMFTSCSVGLCAIPWWQILFPGLAIFLFALSVNLFSDGLRDALDPRMRR